VEVIVWMCSFVRARDCPFSSLCRRLRLPASPGHVCWWKCTRCKLCAALLVPVQERHYYYRPPEIMNSQAPCQTKRNIPHNATPSCMRNARNPAFEACSLTKDLALLIAIPVHGITVPFLLRVRAVWSPHQVWETCIRWGARDFRT